MLVKVWAKKVKVPFYSDIIAKQNRLHDSRSGQEIVDGIIAKRRKKRAQKAVVNDETV